MPPKYFPKPFKGQSASDRLDAKAADSNIEAQHSSTPEEARMKNSQAGAQRRMANTRRSMRQ